eukprot:m.114966 g.114966  ORF g.114966 m.114966 type:complete len:123 (+) comp17133_c0_seq1:353-721(+)
MEMNIAAGPQHPAGHSPESISHFLHSAPVPQAQLRFVSSWFGSWPDEAKRIFLEALCQSALPPDPMAGLFDGLAVTQKHSIVPDHPDPFVQAQCVPTAAVQAALGVYYTISEYGELWQYTWV